MEGAGTAAICNIIAQSGRKLVRFLHDGDSSAFASCREAFPSCKEELCINHAFKNLSKEIRTRISGGDEWAEGIRAWAWRAAREAKEHPDPNSFFVEELKRCVKHHHGNHGDCRHEKTYGEKDIMSPESASILGDILKKYALTADKYTHGRNQSLSESFNHEISNLVPKALPVASMYATRVHLAILSHNQGWQTAIPLVFQRLQLPLSTSIRCWLDARERRKVYDASYFQIVGKTRRRTKKSRKYEKLPHTYKAATTCSCKMGCKNKKCTCRANRNECSQGLCGCGKECTNRSTSSTEVPGERLAASLVLFEPKATPEPETPLKKRKRSESTVLQLRSSCRGLGVSAKGRKGELVARLEALGINDEE